MVLRSFQAEEELENKFLVLDCDVQSDEGGWYRNCGMTSRLLKLRDVNTKVSTPVRACKSLLKTVEELESNVVIHELYA